MLFWTVISPHKLANRAQILCGYCTFVRRPRWSLWPNFIEVLWMNKKLMHRLLFRTPLPTHKSPILDVMGLINIGTSAEARDQIQIKFLAKVSG